MSTHQKTSALTIAILIVSSTFVGLATVPAVVAAGNVGDLIPGLDDDGSVASVGGPAAPDTDIERSRTETRERLATTSRDEAAPGGPVSD